MKRKTFAAWLIGCALIVAITGCPMEGDPPPPIENAAAPIITVQATADGSAYDTNEEITLTFEAVSPDGGSLSWQWYQLPGTYDMGYTQRTALEDDGTDIIGAADAGDPATATCVVKLSADGVYNFFVEVTNTNPAKNGVTTASARSATVMVYVINPADPTPYPIITVHPSGGKRAGAALLSVTATESSGNGTLTYQWYSNTVNSNIGGTLIPSATDPTYNTGAISGGVYYVEVTNTVSPNPPKKVTSRPASVEIVGAVTPNVRVRLSATKQQYVRGFGGMDLTWGNFFRIYPNEYEKLYNPYTGLGLNMIRIIIEPGIKDDVAKTSEFTTHADWIDYVMTEGNRPDYINAVKLVNKYGGYVLASPWTPPSAWKSSNTINGSTHLETSHYVDYANYLKNYAKEMSDRGAPIYAVSLQNEPNFVAAYDGCDWTALQMRDFLLTPGVDFSDIVAGYGGGRGIPNVLIMNGESANSPIFNDEVMANATSRAVIGVLARHNYGNIGTLYPHSANANDPPRYGREMWMTEWNANSGSAGGYPNDWTWNYMWTFLNDVDLSIRQRDDNAHIWWAMKRFYSFIGEGQYGTVEGATLPRGHAIAHYAKFAKEKYRVSLVMAGNLPNGSAANNQTYVNNTGIDRANIAAKVTGFMSADETEFSVVMYTPTNTAGGGGQNLGMVAVELPSGYTATGVEAMRSNALVKSQPEEVILNNTSKIGYVTLPPSNIVSVKFTVIKD